MPNRNVRRALRGLMTLSFVFATCGTGTALATTVAFSPDGATLLVSDAGANVGHRLQFRLETVGTAQFDRIIDTAGFTSYPPECTTAVDAAGILCPGHANLKVGLGAGSDDVTFVSQGFDCFDNYTLNLGDGANELSLSDSCPAGETATVNSGSGPDLLRGGSQGSITFSAGGGDDRVFGSSGNDIVRGGEGNDEIAAQGGDDQLSGEGGNDAVHGMDGNDTVLSGVGNDTLSGGIGNDMVDAGTGDDSIGDAGTGTDTFIGGVGTDELLLEERPGGIAISLDGQANDGTPGENANVGADIELIVGTRGADTFTGRADIDTFYGGQGNDVIRGGGGNDELFGQDDQDQVFGEAGNDRLFGNRGDDVVDGGTGVDSLFGDNADCTAFSCPANNDTMRARDGEADSVQCGAGADTVQADAVDVIAGDGLQACESVDRGAPTSTPPPTSNGSTGTMTPLIKGAIGTIKGGKLRRKALVRGVQLPITCALDSSAKGTLSVTPQVARKLRLKVKGGQKSVLVASGNAACTKTAGGIVRIKFLKSAARKVLKSKRAVKAKLTVLFKRTGSGDVTVTLPVKLT